MLDNNKIPASLGVLPEGYEEVLSIDFTEDKTLLTKVAAWSVWFFFASTLLLLPPLLFRLFVAGDILQLMPFSLWDLLTFPNVMGGLMMMLAMQFVVILLHEGIHGVFFKLHARDAEVKYGFAKGMAYAGCPGVYFARDAYRQIGLAPLFFLSLTSYALLFLGSLTRGWGYTAIACIFLLNTSGAAGDIYTSWATRRLPRDSYFLDTDTGCKAYTKDE